MTKYELTIWIKGNELGITRFYNNKKIALDIIKKAKENPRYRRHSLVRIRNEFYNDLIKKKPYLFKRHNI